MLSWIWWLLQTAIAFVLGAWPTLLIVFSRCEFQLNFLSRVILKRLHLSAFLCRSVSEWSIRPSIGWLTNIEQISWRPIIIPSFSEYYRKNCPNVQIIWFTGWYARAHTHTHIYWMFLQYVNLYLKWHISNGKIIHFQWKSFLIQFPFELWVG